MDWAFERNRTDVVINDEIVKATTLLSDPKQREQLQAEHIQTQIEYKKLKIDIERKKLIPTEEFVQLQNTVSARLRRFGELLKHKGYHDLVASFNEIINDSDERTEKFFDEVITKENNTTTQVPKTKVSKKSAAKSKNKGRKPKYRQL